MLIYVPTVIALSLLRLMSIESVISSNNLILCQRLLLLPSIFLSIRVFSNESALHIRWPKFWSFSFSISPSNNQDWFSIGLIDWFGLRCLQADIFIFHLAFLLSTGKGLVLITEFSIIRTKSWPFLISFLKKVYNFKIIIIIKNFKCLKIQRIENLS